MAYGQRGMYPQQQGSGFYNPHMKGPDWAGGIQGFMQQLAGMKQMQSQREQQQWQKGITEREIALKEEEARKQPPQQKLTRWDYQKNYAQYMNSTGQWDEPQTQTYLAEGKVPQVPVQIDANTKAEIERFSGIKDFNELAPSKQHDYIRTYALQRNKPEPGKPVERESMKLRQDRDKLVSPLVERYEGIVKKIDAALYELGEPGDDPDPKHLQYRRQSHNAKKVLDIARYAQSIVDGGDELTDALRKLIQQLSYKTREIQTGAFFRPDKNGYSLGETRIDSDGKEVIYVGKDTWDYKR